MRNLLSSLIFGHHNNYRHVLGTLGSFLQERITDDLLRLWMNLWGNIRVSSELRFFVMTILTLALVYPLRQFALQTICLTCHSLELRSQKFAILTTVLLKPFATNATHSNIFTLTLNFLDSRNVWVHHFRWDRCLFYRRFMLLATTIFVLT